MKVTYWIADCLDDHASYSIRTRTRRECYEQRGINHGRYAKPRKITIAYSDALDLILKLTSEGGAEGSPE